MRTLRLNAVTVVHRHGWGLWPDTDNIEYAQVLAARREERYVRGDVELLVTNREYPAYLAYLEATHRGLNGGLPVPFPQINNTVLPHPDVLRLQEEHLRELAKECEVIIWDHAWQCFPPVAEKLRELFKLRILIHADDCPESSPTKTFPVAHCFDALFHMMMIYDFRTGSLVADEYRARDLPYCKFRASTESAGLSEYLRESGFDIERKLDAIRGCRKCGRGPIPAPPLGLVFVGAVTASREHLLRELESRVHELEDSWRPCRLHSKSGLRDGPLLPLDYGRGLGHVIAPLYVDAMMSFNVPVSSIWNCRTMDLFLAGTAQIVHDPWGELAREGFRPMEHYLPFDGTCAGLLAVVTAWRQRRAGLADMVERAYHAAHAYVKKTSWAESFGDIYFQHLERLT